MVNQIIIIMPLITLNFILKENYTRGFKNQPSLKWCKNYTPFQNVKIH